MHAHSQANTRKAIVKAAMATVCFLSTAFVLRTINMTKPARASEL
jgi:hypothetical protein